jgi:hypothetical protein
LVVAASGLVPASGLVASGLVPAWLNTGSDSLLSVWRFPDTRLRPGKTNPLEKIKNARNRIIKTPIFGEREVFPV